jgi:hypothetical protein
MLKSQWRHPAPQPPITYAHLDPASFELELRVKIANEDVAGFCALVQHVDNVDKRGVSLNTMCSWIESNESVSWTHMGKHGIWKWVTTVLVESTNEAEIATACLAVSMLEIHSTVVCKALVSILDKFGTNNKDIARMGCKAVGRLAFGNLFHGSRVELGELGACAVVVRALEKFGEDDEEVALEGCFAVRWLAWGVVILGLPNKANIVRLRAAGAVNAVRASKKNFWKSDAVSCFKV